MSVVTYEGVVENGQIRLEGDVKLPEHARVYVLLPNALDAPVARIASPRLVDPRDLARFTVEVVEDRTDAGV